MKTSRFCHFLCNVIKKEKPGRNLDDTVKAYLAECFNKGEVTEQKASAKDVADTMKYKQDSDGKPVFSPDHWLQPSQAVTFFSRQSLLGKNTVSSFNQEGRDRPG